MATPENRQGPRPAASERPRGPLATLPDANHLRHTKFVGLRDDKDPRKVVRES
jgi:hypothetical protein